MRLVPGAPELVAADDQPYVVCAAEKLTLYDAVSKSELASRPLPAEASNAQLGFVGDKLLAIVPGDGRTSLMAYALPSLELVAQLELEERLRAVCFMPSRALVTTESFEQPRIVLVTSRIYLDPIAIREPVMLATAAPEERLLVASRGREQQLECWDPQVRRALFRLNLPLMPTATMAGFSSRRRVLWIAGTTAQAAIEVFRYSDGRLQARVDLDAPVAGATGHPESPRLIVATRADAGTAAKLVELDFARAERRELDVAGPQAMCVVESTPPMLVVHMGGGGAPEWIPLPRVVAAEAMKPSAGAAATAASAERATAAAAPAPAGDWRARLHEGRAATAAAPATEATAAAAFDTTDSEDGAEELDLDEQLAEEDEATKAAPSGSAWRERLCDWTELLLTQPRTKRPLPAFADTQLAEAAERLGLGPRSQRALAIVYGARLLGHDGVPAATLARALNDGAAADDDSWDEALGRGLLARLHLARARDGRLRLRAAAARFLDGAPPRLTVLHGQGAHQLPPSGPAHIRADGPLPALGADLAARFGYDVALLQIESDGEASDRPRRVLADRLCEARLLGAWPIIDSAADPASWLTALDDGPALVVVRGALPDSLAALPPLP